MYVPLDCILDMRVAMQRKAAMIVKGRGRVKVEVRVSPSWAAAYY
jgi:hypothetical protein